MEHNNATGTVLIIFVSNEPFTEGSFHATIQKISSKLDVTNDGQWMLLMRRWPLCLHATICHKRLMEHWALLYLTLNPDRS